MSNISTMISICIPVYNFDVTELTNSLLEQADRIGYPIEILLFDDHSLSYFKKVNAQLNSRKDVNYLEFDFNIGRSKIRNRLADFASGHWLLFLDCDMMIDDPDFLKGYVDSLNKAQVICGGFKYSKKPFREELILRWKYGVFRECKKAILRQLSPYNSFMSGNFLITSEAFHSIRFNEEISGYGHEDTVFGINLKRRKVPILHIDNPSFHLGLEPCFDFLQKSEQSVINLSKLMRNAPDLRKDLERSVRVLKVFKILRILGLTMPLRWVFRAINPIIRRSLCSKHPSLLMFDVYKLALLAKLYSKGWMSSISKYF
ncbi:MAG: glycosyltransferase [Bacteroidales bacterium]|nr:glycosyltransferase [Bacteroidales bacterium]